MRWRLKLEEFYYETVYKAGKTNTNADALSRVQIEQVIRTDNDNLDNTKSPLVIKLFKDKKGNYCHLIEYHDNPLGGHQGHKRTIAALKLKYHWPKMKQDVIDYINTCESCSQRKMSPKDTKPAPMQLSFTPKKPFNM